jgi:hypothetical protein
VVGAVEAGEEASSPTNAYRVAIFWT